MLKLGPHEPLKTEEIDNAFQEAVRVFASKQVDLPDDMARIVNENRDALYFDFPLPERQPDCDGEACEVCQ